MKVKLPPIKKRPPSHRALFDNEQPYKPKKEKRRDQYKRHFKNTRDSQNEQGTDND